MKSFWPVAIITYKEGLRQRVLYGVLIAGFLLILLAVLVSGFFMRDILKVLLDICLSAISAGGLLVPFFLAVNLLAGDIENRTIYTLLARNISRKAYILGKFTGLAMLTATVIGILALASIGAIWFATLIYPGHYFAHYSPLSTIIAIGMTFVGILVLNSTVVLWCSLTTSSFLATLLTLSTYVIGHTMEDMVRFMEMQISDIAISPAIQLTVKCVLYIFPNLAAFDLKQQAAYSLPIPPAETALLCLYGLAYISVILSISIFSFQRRNLP